MAEADAYYSLTDRAPVCLAAIVLHPAFTWSWTRKKWASKPSWITDGEAAVNQLWQGYSKTPVPLQQERTVKRRRIEEECKDIFSLSDSESDSEALPLLADEYSIFVTTQKRLKYVTHPLDWWSTADVQQRFPRLSQMAIDIFTIPAMSDEPERTFSSTGLMITPHRSQLSPETINYAQCLKSWDAQGVIKLKDTFTTTVVQS